MPSLITAPSLPPPPHADPLQDETDGFFLAVFQRSHQQQHGAQAQAGAEVVARATSPAAPAVKQAGLGRRAGSKLGLGGVKRGGSGGAKRGGDGLVDGVKKRQRLEKGAQKEHPGARAGQEAGAVGRAGAGGGRHAGAALQSGGRGNTRKKGGPA